MSEMTYDEFGKWIKYFEMRPVNWREDDAAFKIMQAASSFGGGIKAKPWDLFGSLGAIYKNPEINTSGTDMSTLNGSLLFSKMLDAKGGDKLECLKSL